MISVTCLFGYGNCFISTLNLQLFLPPQLPSLICLWLAWHTATAASILSSTPYWQKITKSIWGTKRQSSPKGNATGFCPKDQRLLDIIRAQRVYRTLKTSYRGGLCVKYHWYWQQQHYSHTRIEELHPKQQQIGVQRARYFYCNRGIISIYEPPLLVLFTINVPIHPMHSFVQNFGLVKSL